MKLHPITEEKFPEAVDLLCRGFPRRSESFWLKALDRASHFLAKDSGWPLGYLLEQDGAMVGIMLTFASWREAPSGSQTLVVNLSGWYVLPQYIGIAPMMLMRIVADRGATYTDLTPAKSVAKMLVRMGFVPWNECVILLPCPIGLVAGAGAGKVLPFEEVPQGALGGFQRRLLEDHESLGCLVAVLHDGEGYAPLIFRTFRHRTRLGKLPTAHLVYAESREAVLKNLRAISSFLLRSGMLVLFMDGYPSAAPWGSAVRERGVRLFRGSIAEDSVDFAYSELVFQELHPEQDDGSP